MDHKYAIKHIRKEKEEGKKVKELAIQHVVPPHDCSRFPPEDKYLSETFKQI